MTLYRPLFMQAAMGDTEFEYDGRALRLMLTGLWSSEGPVNNSFIVSQRGAGANMSVDVSGGTAVVTGNDVSLQGTYMCVSDATVNVTVPAAPASGSRTHRIMLYVKDKLYDGTLAADTYEFAVELQEDTGSGTPTLPPSAISLALVTVAAGQISVTDADITDTRISGLTAPSWLRQSTGADDRPAIPLSGERVYRTDLGCMEITDGSSWFEIPRRDGGGSEWSTYTPTLTATSSNPTLGTGSTAQGRYIRYGRMVTCTAWIRFGTSGVSVGSGFYEISLPVLARTQTVGRRTGSGYLYDSSNDYQDGGCFIDVNVQDRVRLSMNGTVVTPTSPMAFGASDELGFTITYEAAS
ncbi:hypothetical protein [Actinomadura sediminis]|uniref:Uncharacterized protein n=1 Tax=Actinomadura sediminis TaxID=1038904 RepID=A0ABW3ERZ3_9ACTN